MPLNRTTITKKDIKRIVSFYAGFSVLPAQFQLLQLLMKQTITGWQREALIWKSKNFISRWPIPLLVLNYSISAFRVISFLTVNLTRNRRLFPFREGRRKKEIQTPLYEVDAPSLLSTLVFQNGIIIWLEKDIFFLVWHWLTHEETLLCVRIGTPLTCQFHQCVQPPSAPLPSSRAAKNI